MNQSGNQNHRRSENPAELLPVTVVSGFKGAGKTALIDHLRSSASEKRFQVLEDDGERDLVLEIEKLAKANVCDHVIVECAASEEPFFVAEYLVYGDQRSPPPESYRIDSMITVIDASTFISDCLESAELSERDLEFDDDDDRVVTEVLVEQVEFANVLVINKVDLISEESFLRLEALLARLNPQAKIVSATHGQVDLGDVAGTEEFDFDAVEFGAGWLAELEGEFEGIGTEYGVSSFTFSERRPLHPFRFNELLSDLDANGLIRAKGRIWVASRHNEVGIWSLAGLASVLTYGGPWFAATPARDWPEDPTERASIMEEWVPPFGDRRQEIAFIGIDMDEADIRDRLNECLLTPQEMKEPEAWRSFADPLPDWHGDGEEEPYGGSEQNWT